MSSRDDAEANLAPVVNDGVQTYLTQVNDQMQKRLIEAWAAQHIARNPIPLGLLLGWWNTDVAEKIVHQIQREWQTAYTHVFQGRRVVMAERDAMAFHISHVRDRLSRKAVPEIPQHAFDQIRLALSQSVIEGWGHPETARNIAERLQWEPDKSYWKDQKAAAERGLDALLDPYGKPGSAAREAFKARSHEVATLMQVRQDAQDRITDDESVWQVRATRISRTESTAAWNSGALAALAHEDVPYKRWVATEDTRTRETHRVADGQTVKMDQPFKVGGWLMQMPGDPTAPPHEVCNCRCVVIGAHAINEELLPKHLVASPAGMHYLDELRIPKGNPKAGEWTFTPWKYLQDAWDQFASLDGAVQTNGAVASEKKKQWDTKVVPHMELAQHILASVSKDQFDPGDPKLKVAAESAAAQLDFAADGAHEMGLGLLTNHLRTSAKEMDAFAHIDWSLFHESTDIGANDPPGDVGVIGEALKNPVGDHHAPMSGVNENPTLQDLVIAPVGSKIAFKDFSSVYTKEKDGYWSFPGWAKKWGTSEFTPNINSGSISLLPPDVEPEPKWDQSTTVAKLAKDVQVGDILQGGVVASIGMPHHDQVEFYDKNGDQISYAHPYDGLLVNSKEPYIPQVMVAPAVEVIPETPPNVLVDAKTQPGATETKLGGLKAHEVMAGDVLLHPSGKSFTVTEVKTGPKLTSIFVEGLKYPKHRVANDGGDTFDVIRTVYPQKMTVSAGQVQIGDKVKGKAVTNVTVGPKLTSVYVEGLKYPIRVKHGDTIEVERSVGGKPLHDPALPVTKWTGVPAPKAPVAPVEPVPGKPAPGAFDQWLAAAKDRYAAHAGANKSDLEASNNFQLFNDVMSGDETQAGPALKTLLTKGYLDQNLHDQAVQIYKDAATPDPSIEAKYVADKAAFDKAQQQYESDIAAWKQANPHALQGMDGAAAPYFSSNSAATDWAASHLPTPKAGGKKAIKDYTGNAYVGINSALGTAKGDDSALSASHRSVAQSMDKGFSPSPEDFYVYRGTDIYKMLNLPKGQNPEHQLKALAGTQITSWSYMSTSVSSTDYPSAAFSGKPVQMMIRIPKGVMITNVVSSEHSHHSGEREIIIGRGTRLFIHNVTYHDGKWWVEAEALPPDAPDVTAGSVMPLTTQHGHWGPQGD